MNTLKVLCVAVCFLGAFAPALGQDSCGVLSTKFYIQNVHSGNYLTYEPTNDMILVTINAGIPQQIWEYKGQVLYNTYNNGVLTVGPCVGDTCALSLKSVADINSVTDDQKWDFNEDGSITSLSGYTMSTYDVYEPRILVTAYKDRIGIIKGNDEYFRVVLATN